MGRVFMKRNTRVLATVLAAIGSWILGASALAAWGSAAGAGAGWRLPFRLLCHGLPARSLELFGAEMPICARCTGIYLGLLSGLVVFLVHAMAGAAAGRFSALRFTGLWLLIWVAPLAIDGLTQATGMRESTNTLRMATGLAAGMAFGLWVLSEVEHHEAHNLSVS